VPGIHNKFVFASFQGKSHEKVKGSGDKTSQDGNLIEE